MHVSCMCAILVLSILYTGVCGEEITLTLTLTLTHVPPIPRDRPGIVPRTSMGEDEHLLTPTAKTVNP